jgi:hypothetical protein
MQFAGHMAAGAYQAAAMVLLEAVVFGFLIQQAFTLFVKLIGPEAAMILGMLVAMYVGFKHFFGEGGIGSMPWAKELLQGVNGLFKASNDVVQDMLLGLKEEAEAFQTTVETKTELLKTTNDLLWVDPIMKPIILLGELPGQYIYRSIHTSNIGTTSFDLLHNYVSNQVRLPTLAETEQMFSGNVNRFA